MNLPSLCLLAGLLSLPAFLSAAETAAVTPSDRAAALEQALEKRFVGEDVGTPEPLPMAGLYRVRVGGRLLHVTADGEYAFTGDLLELGSGRNLTEEIRSKARLESIAAIPEQDRVVYPAQGETRAVLVAFTDTTCAYCRKLHAEVPALQKAGVAVHYLPFARGGPQSEGAKQLRSVWCAADRAVAMDIGKGVRPGELGAGDCDAAKWVERGGRLANELGIRGTPALILPDGRFHSGYRPAPQLLELMGLKPQS